MHCEKATSKSKEELIQFLKKSEEHALFLLSNLETYGLELSEGLYSGNFKVIREQSKIVTAFCLTKKGTLLVQSSVMDVKIYDTILLACSEEKIPIAGVIGEWEFCHALWDFLKEKKIIQHETVVSKEVLYALILAQFAHSADPDARLLQKPDFDEWITLRKGYVHEMGFPENTLEEMQEEFMEKVDQRIAWGLFVEKRMAAIADLNARFFDLGQVGGVYTIPALRKRGLSTRLMQHLIHDSKTLHRIRKLIIFTGEANFPARNVYESLGISPHSHYALLFGS
jgi:GNAT superfamily N-acetyltransferase